MNNRRGFLGTIFAAIFGRKLAKQEYVTPMMDASSLGEKRFTVTEMWVKNPDGIYHNIIFKPRSLGLTTLYSGRSVYWHEQAPFVTFVPKPFPWENPPSR
jgi:hypothetical protein